FIFCFFQAEDGIRDDLVTGVQTCALPIFSEDDSDGGPLPPSAVGLGIDAEAKLFGGFNGSHVGRGVRFADGPALVVDGGLGEDRSEERRVGKDCRIRIARYIYNRYKPELE